MNSAPGSSLFVRPQTETISSGDCGRGMASKGCGEKTVAVMPNEEEADEAIDEEIIAEDVEPRRVMPTPVLPSQADIDEHMVDHNPYRAWCDSCVAGQGQEVPHKRSDHGKRHIPLVSFDYFFVAKKGMFTRAEWQIEKAKPENVDAESLKVLVVRDSMTKCMFAHAVEKKGDDEQGYIVDCLVRDIEWLGHSKVVFKTDNEPAIVKVLRESLKSLRIEGIEQAAEEHPPPYDPQANGEIENTVKMVKGRARTFVHALEQRILKKIPPTHPVLSWLVEHAAMSMTRRSRGADGMTAWQRARGRPFGARMMEFGEFMRFKVNGSTALKRSTLDSRWEHVFFPQEFAVPLCSTWCIMMGLLFRQGQS